MKPIPILPTVLFLILVSIVFYALLRTMRAGMQHTTPFQRNVPFVALLLLLTVQSIAAYSGVLLEETMPPRLLLIALPSVLFALIFSLLYKPIAGHAFKFSRASMVYLQSFRLPLELLFLWFYTDGILPLQMTFEGRNPDVLIGLTAPFIAYWGIQQQKLPHWVIIAWNFFGLATLFNIVTIAVLSAPSPIRYFMNEPANTLVLQFPYQFIPTFLVPLALFLHLFSLKQHFALLRKPKADRGSAIAA